MKPAVLPLTIYQGQTFKKTITWTTGETQAVAVPVDLTGCTARMQARESFESDVVLLGLTTENGGIILGGPSGEIRLHISAVDTAALSWRGALYDLEIVFPDGTVIRRMQGKIVVSPEVTRAE